MKYHIKKIPERRLKHTHSQLTDKIETRQVDMCNRIINTTTKHFNNRVVDRLVQQLILTDEYSRKLSMWDRFP